LFCRFLDSVDQYNRNNESIAGLIRYLKAPYTGDGPMKFTGNDSHWDKYADMRHAWIDKALVCNLSLLSVRKSHFNFLFNPAIVLVCSYVREDFFSAFITYFCNFFFFFILRLLYFISSYPLIFNPSLDEPSDLSILFRGKSWFSLLIWQVNLWFDWLVKTSFDIYIFKFFKK
jgi:hypothetical protein